MEVISISLSDALLEQLDTFVDEHGYGGRSEVVREAARALFTEFEDRHFDDRPLLGLSLSGSNTTVRRSKTGYDVFVTNTTLSSSRTHTIASVIGAAAWSCFFLRLCLRTSPGSFGKPGRSTRH